MQDKTSVTGREGERAGSELDFVLVLQKEKLAVYIQRGKVQ